MQIRFWEVEHPGPVSPEILLAFSVIATAPIDGIFWITDIAGPGHMRGSEHHPWTDPDGESDALDGDANDTEKNRRLASHLRRSLPDAFDVLHEDPNGDAEHVHVEYDREMSPAESR